MRSRLLDKRVLIHSIKWSKKRLLAENEEEAHVIDRVRLVPQIYFQPIGMQESNVGNWKLFYCPVQSGKVNGEMPKFSIGDTIEFMPNYAPIYPKSTTITNIQPQWDLDGKSVHHYEIILR